MKVPLDPFQFAVGAPPPTPPIPPKNVTHPRRGIEQVLDRRVLKVRWRRMRRELRKLRPIAIQLPYDALEWLAFESEVDPRLDELTDLVRAGDYRATKPEVVRAAKSLGLTRPLAFLSIPDALLYKNIVSLAETDLLQEMQPWTRFGRADSQQDTDGNFDSDSGWFRAWLRRNAQLWVITENHEWIVETDISNFFPSVHLDTVLDHLLAHSQLGVDVVRLLSHMLREFAPVPEYRVSPLIGLPQEPFDCSRVLAHSFLGAVDEAFKSEGSHHAFSRYMDDIVIGAASKEEGHEYVARAQRTLEKLGLYPNTAKTRVTPTADFIADHMKDENDYLGLVDEAVSRSGEVDLIEFEARLQAHMNLQIRPKAWERVFRRYLTLSRQLRSETLLAECLGQIPELPGSTRAILDYAATFPLTESRVEQLRAAVSQAGAMYEDVGLLAFEFLGVVPNDDAASLRSSICEWANHTFDVRRKDQARLSSVAVTLLGKFGEDSHLDALASALNALPIDEPPVRRQLLTVALAGGRIDFDESRRFAGESSGMAEAVRLLSRLADSEKAVVQMTLDAAKPRERQKPRIWMFSSRAMFLAAALGRINPEALEKRRSGWANLVKTSDAMHHDLAAGRWLGIKIA